MPPATDEVEADGSPQGTTTKEVRIMPATLRRHRHVEDPAGAAKPRLEGTRATLRALGTAALTLIGVHRH
jgi:hypothetical protein